MTRADAARRGMERERERCARIAEDTLARLVEIQTKSPDVSAAVLASDRQIVVEGIAAAIRKEPRP